MSTIDKSDRYKVVTLPWVATLIIYGVCFPPLATGWLFYVKGLGFLAYVGQIYIIGIPLAFCLGALTMAFVWKNKRDTLWEALNACGAVFLLALGWLLLLILKGTSGATMEGDVQPFILTCLLSTLVALLCWRASHPFRRAWVLHMQNEELKDPPLSKE